MYSRGLRKELIKFELINWVLMLLETVIGITECIFIVLFRAQLQGYTLITLQLLT